MSSSPSVLHVLFGDPTDGVHIYAERTAQVRSDSGRRSTVLPSGTEVSGTVGHDAVHVHVTDRIVESDPARWAQLLHAVRVAGVALVVTLHDLPQRAEGSDRYQRRAVAARSIASLAHLVCVSSEHERQCAAAIGIPASTVPHPIFAPSTTITTGTLQRRRRSLTVAGFVHPGKGVLELVDAIGCVGGTELDGWHLRLVGDVVPRHRDHLHDIVSSCRRNGLPVVHTGPVDDRRWLQELTSAGVAICSHRHMSASGSVLSWIAAGRRPLVSDTAFARELEAERAGAVRIVDDDLWRPAISESLRSDDTETPTTRWRTPQQSAEVFERVLGEALETWPRNGSRRDRPHHGRCGHSVL